MLTSRQAEGRLYRHPRKGYSQGVELKERVDIVTKTMMFPEKLRAPRPQEPGYGDARKVAPLGNRRRLRFLLPNQVRRKLISTPTPIFGVTVNAGSEAQPSAAGDPVRKFVVRRMGFTLSGEGAHAKSDRGCC